MDAGVAWMQVVSGRCDDIVFSPNGINAYIIGNGTGYRVSTDGGVTFTLNGEINIGIKNHIAICRNSPAILYISVSTMTYTSVFKSTNSGLNFAKVGLGTNFDGGGQALYDFYIHVNPSDPDNAYIGLASIWRTTDGGISFQNISYSVPNIMHTGQNNMDFNPVNSNELIAVNSGGVWKSTDRGSSWINLNGSLTLTQFHNIAADPLNVNHIIGGTQDNGTQQTFGTLNYTAAFGSHGGEVCFHAVNPQYIIGETQINSIEYSTNGGSSWQSGNSGLTGYGSWIGPIISHPAAPGVYYTARQRVHISTDWGASWTPISSGTEGTIMELAISKTDPNIMYATWGNNIYKSTDAGVTFTNVSSGLPQRVITSVYVHPDSSDVAVLSFSGFGEGKIYKTTNGASSWLNISGNLPDSPANDVLIYYPNAATSILFAATDVGVFFTDNYGASWIELSDGLPNTVAMHLDYHSATNMLRIGTFGRGIWETPNPIGVINYNNEIPSAYSLSQNYPNPFNPLTIIKYQVSSPGFVKLAVYDMLGRELKAIVNEDQNAGTYTVQFDGTGLSSGTYFYRLAANNYTETKKMILVK